MTLQTRQLRIAIKTHFQAHLRNTGENCAARGVRALINATLHFHEYGWFENNPILDIINNPPCFLRAFVCESHMLWFRIWIWSEMRMLAWTRPRVHVVDIASTTVIVF